MLTFVCREGEWKVVIFWSSDIISITGGCDPNYFNLSIQISNP